MLVSRRHFFFGSLALPAMAATKPPVRPNVVLILVDGLPDWALGSYGNKEVLTPNLDRLAQMGTRFSNHFACTPAAALSRATILTGRTPMQLGDAANPTVGAGSLDQILGGAGYSVHGSAVGAAGAIVDQQAPAGKPFFLTATFPGLQPPYEGVAQKFQDLYAKTRFETLDSQPAAAANARAGKEMLADTVGNLRKYAAAVSALDADVGALVQKLSERRLLDHTLIVFTSSCGALLGRHGLWGAGDASEPANMFDEVVGTPLIWAWSGRVPAQGVRPEMVSTYDFVPSVCELAGAAMPSGNYCGRSYVLLATGKPLPKKQPWRKTVFGHYQATDMARSERYKLVMHRAGKGELYDLREDPGEKVNQYDNQQFLTVRNSLADGLAAWKQHYSS